LKGAYFLLVAVCYILNICTKMSEQLFKLFKVNVSLNWK